MSCKLSHRYTVYPEGSDPAVYEGTNERRAATILASLPHSDDFKSGAFAMATHGDMSFCLDETKRVETDASRATQ